MRTMAPEVTLLTVGGGVPKAARPRPGSRNFAATSRPSRRRASPLRPRLRGLDVNGASAVAILTDGRCSSSRSSSTRPVSSRRSAWSPPRQARRPARAAADLRALTAHVSRAGRGVAVRPLCLFRWPDPTPSRRLPVTIEQTRPDVQTLPLVDISRFRPRPAGGLPGRAAARGPRRRLLLRDRARHPGGGDGRRPRGGPRVLRPPARGPARDRERELAAVPRVQPGGHRAHGRSRGPARPDRRRAGTAGPRGGAGRQAVPRPDRPQPVAARRAVAAAGGAALARRGRPGLLRGPARARRRARPAGDVLRRVVRRGGAHPRQGRALPGRERAESDQGVGAHKDYGWLALLLQDDLGGLQVEAKDGSWIDAVPIPGRSCSTSARCSRSRPRGTCARRGTAW